MGRAYTTGEKMNYFAEKLIGLVLCTVFGFTLIPEAPRALSEPSQTIELAPYLIEPTTTTSSTSSTIYIDPYSSACEQFSALAINLGWDPDQRTVLESIMFRESRCIPSSVNPNDPKGSYGLMQVNGFWLEYLSDRGIITELSDLLQAQTNLIAALEIYNYGMDRYGYGWGPWSATK
jgi:hypothetical protein